MKEPFVSRLLKIVLYIIFGLGVLGTATLPFTLEWYTGHFYDAYYLQPGYRMFILTFLMIVGAFGLWVIFELIRMLKTIASGPFIMRNVSSLRRIGAVTLLIACLFFLKCFFYDTFLTLACGFLLGLCGLFAFTLASLFRQAVAYKEENDLTI